MNQTRLPSFPHPVITAVCFAIAITACVLANKLVFSMVHKINDQSPADARESYLGWGPSKTVRVYQKYRNLYPTGLLHLYVGCMIACMFLAMIAFLASVG